MQRGWIFYRGETKNVFSHKQGSSLITCEGIAIVAFCSNTKVISTGFSTASDSSYMQLLKIAFGMWEVISPALKY
jgi:hypothetical protein